MRNGNDGAMVVNLTRMGSYRTYEEWKLILDVRDNWYSILVLTVPMRNGNLPNRLRFLTKVFSFLPYL